MADKPVNEPDLSIDEPDPSADPAAEAPDPAAAIRKERDDYKDRWIRKTAEFDNYRKRIERERR